MRAHRIPLAALLAIAVTATGCRNRQAPATPQPAPVAATPAPSGPSDADRAAADARDRAERERLERERAAADLARSLGATIYFDLDRSDLSSDARATLDAKLGVLTSSPAIRIRIAGHTDERGSDEYNIALGQRRAAAAKRYLVQRGIAADRIDITSFGEEQPVCTESYEGCWSRNRRDEFEITAGAPVAQRGGS